MTGRAPGVVWIAAIAAAIAGAVLPTPWWQLGLIALAIAICALAGRPSSPPLRLGIIAALVFVLLRLVYRVLFASAVAPPADAVLLLDLPSVPLGGPFEDITLFGPLTLDQALGALADASRFAVVFVVFGAANALADARTLLARAPRMLRPVATVLALALGTVPALIASVQRVARAARMRGEKPGVRLLVPVLEQAVERSTTLGASMELRGASGAASTRDSATEPSGESGDAVEPGDAGESDSIDGSSPELLRASGLSMSFDGAEVLSVADLVLSPGEVVVLTGPTGSGKSTLLAALAGLAPAYTGGELRGELLRNGRTVTETRPSKFAGWVALVPQRVEHSFLAETVRGELAFAPAQRGAGGTELEQAVDSALDRFGLRELAERDPGALSAGEATRTAIAAAWLSRPRVLLLDEPVADLDPDSVLAVLEAVHDLVAEGCAVVIAEHRPETLRALESDASVTWLRMESGGRVLPDETRGSGDEGETAESRAPAVSAAPGIPVGSARAAAGQPAEALVLARDLEVRRNDRTLLRVEEFAVAPGEIVVLTGPNGCGKTSLLEDIALPGGNDRAEEVVLVPHRVDDLLIRDSLGAECRFADRRAGAPRGTTMRRFHELLADSLDDMRLARLIATHPRDLSAGTRLVLGIAVQLAHEPRVLLLDEPTRGLDGDARERLALLVAELAAQGTGALLATHDARFVDRLAGASASGRGTRRLRVAEGAIIADGVLLADGDGDD